MIHEIDKSAGETLMMSLLLVWLVALPLPFGSNVQAALPLVVHVPLLLCLMVAVFRMWLERERVDTRPPRAYWIASVGSVLFLALVVFQLLPLPPFLLRLISPNASATWIAATRTLALAGSETRSWFPLSLDPAITVRELLRLAGLFAAFQAASLLVRTHGRRIALAVALGCSAMFQVVYAVHEAALGRFAIWGWKNTKIYGRMTGTYVNPNHFGHYLAIAVPLLLFLAACAWHDAAPPQVTRRRRLVAAFERHFFSIGSVAVAVVACVAGILLAQSRGGLIALFGGGSLAIAMVITRPGARSKGRTIGVALLAGVLALLALAALVVFLGEERTVARFVPSEQQAATLIGRRTGFAAAAGLVRAFPLFGTGAGTFESVVSMTQQRDPDLVYHHAHNDFAEIAATTGILGFAIALATLAGAFSGVWRNTLGAASVDVRWRRRAYQAAALSTLLIAAVHALFDFNFFIPANAATLAVILGAAVAPLHHDIRTRL